MEAHMAKVNPFLKIEGIEIRFAYAHLDGESFNQPCLITNAPYQTNMSNPQVNHPLLEVLNENVHLFSGHKQVTFVYYLTTEPKTLSECEETLVAITFGMPQPKWYHSYSDLTGYLWTEYSLKADRKINGKTVDSGHDVIKQIEQVIGNRYNTDTYYLTLEIRAH
jgi:hypothetical protein